MEPGLVYKQNGLYARIETELVLINLEFLFGLLCFGYDHQVDLIEDLDYEVYGQKNNNLYST